MFMMDDPNITMDEYIKLKAEKAQRRSQTFNWETATYVMFMMDDPNITMDEYIKLKAEKAQRRSQTFNWETATYGNADYDNLDFFTYFEVDFPGIVYNDALTSNENVSSETTASTFFFTLKMVSEDEYCDNW
nr:hypothetical protein [Tanacetum cinerariifolium]